MLKPNHRQLEWYARERTAFFHFGMNTFTEREWGDGTESPAIFDPTELDCRQWLRAIKENGFDAAILTAKHHDGFCLWPSKYTEHSIKNSPYKNGKGDIVREFTDACHEFGIKAGIYLSPWDRHEPTWGSEEYNDFYVGQLTELLTNYGEIYEVWWDGAGSEKAHYDWSRWGETVRTLQPNAVIFGSLGATPYVDVRWVGNEKGIAGKPCYSTVDYRDLELETTSKLNSGSADGTAFIPAESDVSIRPGWFYHDDQDTDVRSPHNLVDLWFASRGRNSGLLLNIPPDRRGLLCDADVQALQGAHRILTDALSHNLAQGATVSDAAKKAVEAAPLLGTDPADFIQLDSENSELLISLNGKQTFNMFTLSEPIEHGCAIRELCIDAWQDGEWKTFAETLCVGNLFSERVPTVTTEKLRIRVRSAIEAPKLYRFGIYRIEEPDPTAELPLTAYNLLTRRRAVIETLPNGWDINLGGIYPFNQLRLAEGAHALKVEIFNGTIFETLVDLQECSGEALTVDLPQTVDWAYRLRITVKASALPERPKLYLI